MFSSEHTDAITAALARAQGEFPPIEKRRTARVQMKAGGSYTYKYADIADVLAAVTPALSRNGLYISQPTYVQDGALHVQTTIMHLSGQWIRSDYPACSLSGDHKAMGAALTYARRYALSSLLGVAAEDDVEGEGGEDTSHFIDPDAMRREMEAEKKAKPIEPAVSSEAIAMARELSASGTIDDFEELRNSQRFRSFWARANSVDRRHVQNLADETKARLDRNPPPPPHA